MHIDIPDRASSLTISMDLSPTATEPSAAASTPPDVPAANWGSSANFKAELASPTFTQLSRRYEVGGGRSLGTLLFLTDSRRLADHVDAKVVETIFDAIQRGGYDICDVTGSGGSTVEPAAAAGLLRRHIAAKTPTQVVIIGGYDVIPAQQVDVLPAEMAESTRNELRPMDSDGFVVWSDDIYADIDGGGLPDLPISRIPDGHDALFTLKLLQADPLEAPARRGIRNYFRKFVEPIYNTLAGTAPLLVSEPEIAAKLSTGALNGSLMYFMLHGDYHDATRFWGEDTQGNMLEALRLDKVPTSGVDVAVMGCCWGALPASTRAFDWVAGSPIAGRLQNQSIALTL